MAAICIWAAKPIPPSTGTPPHSSDETERQKPPQDLIEKQSIRHPLQPPSMRRHIQPGRLSMSNKSTWAETLFTLGSFMIIRQWEGWWSLRHKLGFLTKGIEGIRIMEWGGCSATINHDSWERAAISALWVWSCERQTMLSNVRVRVSCKRKRAVTELVMLLLPFKTVGQTLFGKDRETGVVY